MKIIKRDEKIKIKRNFWDWLAWAAYIYLMIYLFLKLFGFIHSPISLDTFAYISLAYYFGRYANKIDTMESNVKEINLKLEEHVKDKNLHR